MDFFFVFSGTNAIQAAGPVLFQGNAYDLPGQEDKVSFKSDQEETLREFLSKRQRYRCYLVRVISYHDLLISDQALKGIFIHRLPQFDLISIGVHDPSKLPIGIFFHFAYNLYAFFLQYL